ncbi:hypothetical protein FHS57_004741 [Runella defluvii]|uniref:Uncharacterized protein n=1 Tax=Runella defluvii TaxID=370973 RepID=A0A7W6ESR1_9BACT|nr:hypothetical protein [Runella defluvii]MBB3840721.1 hypothetical protein [Runella defluvii]
MAQTNEPEKIRLEDKQEEYLKLEVGKLNNEVGKLLDEANSREKYSITIITGVAGWVLANIRDEEFQLLIAISFIPFISTLVYGISVLFIYDNIKWIGEYLLKIENYYLENPSELDGKGWGWEKYYNFKNSNKRFVKTTKFLWVLQIVLCLTLFVVVYKKDSIFPKKSELQQTKCCKK